MMVRALRGREEMSEQQRVGVVGVGRMGANMARRLKDVGYPVVAVYDVRPDAARELAAELGAEAASSLARVTELSDVIVTVVTDDAAMRGIYATSGDSLLTNARGKIFINSATITPDVHVEVQGLVEERGGYSREDGLVGPNPPARVGTLSMMAAAGRETFDRVEPMLRKMSKNLRYIGEAGQAAK